MNDSTLPATTEVLGSVPDDDATTDAAALVLRPVHDTPSRPRTRNQRGMVSAEWAVGIIAAIAIAGVLLGVVTSGQVKAGILRFILQVISAFSKHMGAI